MSTYTSRHNPRRQLVVQGKVLLAERYDRYYDITWEALQQGLLPLISLEAGRLMFRKADRDIESARTIAPAAHSSQSLSVRYSGARLTGQAGQGALYLASLAALLREHVHYSQPAAAAPLLIRPGAPDRSLAATRQVMAGGVSAAATAAAAIKPFHAYRLNTAVKVADLRVLALAKVFHAVLDAPGARARFALSPQLSVDLMVQAVLDPHDYSAARGMADALADRGAALGVAGLVATSARGDSDSGVALFGHGDGVEGWVAALFGTPGVALAALAPLASFATFKELVDGAKTLPGFHWIA